MSTDRRPELYKQMADLTQPECASCPTPFRCCSPEYCEATIEYAKQIWDTELQPTGHGKLPMMGPSGCIAAPHLRPMCTLHTCDINGMGFKKQDVGGVWTDRYFDLRALINEAEEAAFARTGKLCV